MTKPKINVVETESTTEAPVTIAKPEGFDLNKFKSTQAATIANVETLMPALPLHKISEAGDYVRLHPDEDKYWSDELCFVNVPIKGSKRGSLHLITEDLARRFLDSGKIKRFRIALASKPGDIFFLCLVPTRNLDNGYNATSIEGCERAKTTWVEAVSLREQGIEAYQINAARNPTAFPEPKWPSQPLYEMIWKHFVGRIIDREDHPALLRLIGA
jgi:hypothetical protein